jgi:hypothetical protein
MRPAQIQDATKEKFVENEDWEGKKTDERKA